MAAEAVLVHDIAPPHPRYTQLTQMAADVARRTQGMLSIAINPGGKVLYPGQASLDAVRSGRVPLTFVNSAFLQSVDPELGRVTRQAVLLPRCYHSIPNLPVLRPFRSLRFVEKTVG